MSASFLLKHELAEISSFVCPPCMILEAAIKGDKLLYTEVWCKFMAIVKLHINLPGTLDNPKFLIEFASKKASVYIASYITVIKYLLYKQLILIYIQY